MEEEKIYLDSVQITDEQLKTFYNSEQWETIREKYIKIGENLIKLIKPIVENVIKSINPIIEILYKELYEYASDPEIKKCYGIYKRTRNKRIRKKQMTRIQKIIRGYIKNGDMDKSTE